MSAERDLNADVLWRTALECAADYDDLDGAGARINRIVRRRSLKRGLACSVPALVAAVVVFMPADTSTSALDVRAVIDVPRTTTTSSVTAGETTPPSAATPTSSANDTPSRMVSSPPSPPTAASTPRTEPTLPLSPTSAHAAPTTNAPKGATTTRPRDGAIAVAWGAFPPGLGLPAGFTYDGQTWFVDQEAAPVTMDAGLSRFEFASFGDEDEPCEFVVRLETTNGFFAFVAIVESGGSNAVEQNLAPGEYDLTFEGEPYGSYTIPIVVE